MADNDGTEEPTDTRELLERVERHEGPDLVLQFLVDMLNCLGGTVSVGVTVLLHGQVVTGNAVSGREFFEGVARAAKLPLPGDNEASSTVRDGLVQQFEALRDTFPVFFHGRRTMICPLPSRRPLISISKTPG